MKREVYYRELPEGYEPVKTIDAIKDKRYAVWFNVIALIIGIVLIVVLSLFIYPEGLGVVFNKFVESLEQTHGMSLLALFVFIVAMLLYIVLHELVHGLVYKIETKEKLTFGLSLSCAYCGVPTLYVGRVPALIAIFAPFVVFNIVFILLIVFLTSFYQLLAIVLLGIHVGGCAGDLFIGILLLFKYKGDVYINDNGPRQIIYVRKSN